jgi:hypothetical protein
MYNESEWLSLNRLWLFEPYALKHAQTRVFQSEDATEGVPRDVIARSSGLPLENVKP